MNILIKWLSYTKFVPTTVPVICSVPVISLTCTPIKYIYIYIPIMGLANSTIF